MTDPATIAQQVAPASDEASAETLSLTDAFLKGGLEFQAPESQTAPAPVEVPGQENETFEEQQVRMGWDKPAEAQAAQPAQQAQQAAPTPAPAPVVPGGRDYNGLPPEDVKVFKQMSNEAYSRLRPLYDQQRQWEATKAEREAKEAEMAQQLKELKGHQFYDLPNAWQLDPEIQPLAAAQQQLAAEADFWQKQLAAIDRQEKIQLLVLDEQGTPKLTQPMDPEPEHRAMITRAMQDALAKHSQVSAQVTTSVQNFKARYQGWDDMISEQTNRVFGKFEKHIQKSRDEIMQQFPAALRHKPIYNYAASATAAIAMLLRDNETLKKQVAGQKLNQPAMASATPRAVTSATGSPDNISALERLAKLSGKSIVVPKG